MYPNPFSPPPLLTLPDSSSPLTIELDPAVWYRGQAEADNDQHEAWRNMTIEERAQFNIEDSIGSLLLRPDGRRCCWGIALGQVGVEDSLLLYKGTAHVVVRLQQPRHGSEPVPVGTCDLSDQYLINDRTGLGDAERVAALNADAEARSLPFRFTLKEA